MGSAPSVTCQLCQAVNANRKRLRLHARLHYVLCFCSCGYNSKWREMGRTHQKDRRNACDSAIPVYEVDAASFASWRRTLNVALDAFPGEMPTRVIYATPVTSTSTASHPTRLSTQPPSTSRPCTSTLSTSGTRTISHVDAAPVSTLINEFFIPEPEAPLRE